MTLDLAQDIVILLGDDYGVATKGSETTLEDLGKNWEEVRADTFGTYSRR